MDSANDQSTSRHEVDELLFPKPPTLEHGSHIQYGATIDDLSGPSADPPPPYPTGSAGRRTRRSARRTARCALQSSDDSRIRANSSGESESSPLLGTRRQRTISHSTIYSVQSLAHTVFTLFEAETEANTLVTSGDQSVPSLLQSTSDLPYSQRAKRYFRPLTRRVYYAALFHLLFLNFPYELGAWTFLFVGTLTGTTLLITLPLGAILCFFDLLGARALAHGEIAMQTYFHGPLCVTPRISRPRIFSRARSPSPEVSSASLENGRHDPVPVPETSFLRLTYLMFRDPTSYQALFYFLVIKPGLTLLITLALIILVPPAFILVVPAPAVLRAVRRVGIWQAEVAIDALGYA